MKTLCTSHKAMAHAWRGPLDATHCLLWCGSVVSTHQSWTWSPSFLHENCLWRKLLTPVRAEVVHTGITGTTIGGCEHQLVAVLILGMHQLVAVLIMGHRNIKCHGVLAAPLVCGTRRNRQFASITVTASSVDRDAKKMAPFYRLIQE